LKPEDLLQKAMNAGLCLTPEALAFLKELPPDKADAVMNQLSGQIFVTQEVVSELLRREEGVPQQVSPALPPAKPAVRILKDITGKSSCRGELKDFISLFRDRFQRLASVLKSRPALNPTVPLSSLPRMEPGEEVRVIGMVADKRETPQGHIVVELEDPAGRASVWIFKSSELTSSAREILPDEVLGVIGRVRESWGGSPSIFAREILWPELHPRAWEGPEEPVYAVFISDLHIGSQMFLESTFRKFLSWLKGEGEGKLRELAEGVRYLLIAGDVTDGIGIYPQQERELAIADIFKQYEYAAELLSEIPDHITVIISPGNHDAVRAAEPQPAIPKEVAGRFYELGYQMVGNPCVLDLEGIRVLMYHGRSFDDLATVLGMPRDKPTNMMRMLLRKRHLSPFYGGKTALAPENQDLMVVDEPPNIFHCGHAHIFGESEYKGMLLLNSGTFQGRTSYMRKQGINPTPGYVPVVNLQNGKVTVLHFA